MATLLARMLTSLISPSDLHAWTDKQWRATWRVEARRVVRLRH